jgi:hypothetical protein
VADQLNDLMAMPHFAAGAFGAMECRNAQTLFKRFAGMSGTGG